MAGCDFGQRADQVYKGSEALDPLTEDEVCSLSSQSTYLQQQELCTAWDQPPGTWSSGQPQFQAETMPAHGHAFEVMLPGKPDKGRHLIPVFLGIGIRAGRQLSFLFAPYD